jgi:predicted HTH domain antitoxin
MRITLEVPDRFLFDCAPAELTQRIKLYAAVLMFRAGELSAGAAAELAQIDRFAFAQECHRHGVALVSYPTEDLQQELTDLS